MANQLAAAPGLTRYVRDVSLRDDAVLRDLRELTAELPMGGAMQVMAEEGQLLALLVGLTGGRAVLELGTFTGYSTLCMARALAPGGRLVTCDVTDRWASIARDAWRRAGVADRITERLGPAADTLAALERDAGPGSFDLVFVDADKAGYLGYYESALRLLRDGGLVVVDNTLYFGRVVDPGAGDPDTEAVRAFNAVLRDDPRVDLSLLPMADGITLARKRGAAG